MNRINSSILTVIFLLALAVSVLADVKVRQKVTMNGQTYETVTMIKGARQRTENKGEGPAAAMMSQVVTITQCDLRRNIQLNDVKKIYFVEKFAEEVDAAQNQTSTNKSSNQTKRGGTVTITISITDTGERKTLFGFVARHLIRVMEMESSPDSCGGASKTKMEIDAWYIDFAADFNCPASVRYGQQRETKPDCMDRVVFKQTGKGKDGFMLNGTTKFYDQNGSVTMTQTTESLEISRETLAAALFDIPSDYKSVSSSQEIYSMPNMQDLMKKNGNQNKQLNGSMKTVGVNIKASNGVKINQLEINQYLAAKLREKDLNSRADATSEVDYVLNVEIVKVKESSAGKVGGIFGKVTGVETKVGKTEVEMIVTLTKFGSNTPVRQSRLAKKFDGNASEAVRTAIDEAMENILIELRNKLIF